MRRALLRAAAFCFALGLAQSGAAPAPALRVPLAPQAAPQMQSTVDLNLVLAIDASGSVDDERFDLQKRGYAQAFVSQRVLDAIRNGNYQSIAVPSSSGLARRFRSSWCRGPWSRTGPPRNW